MAGFVYILCNRPRGVLYVGVTSDLLVRTDQHRQKIFGGFTARYGLARFVYYEAFDDIGDAIHREKRLKHWLRQWKVDLVEAGNPDWHDLWPEISGQVGEDGGRSSGQAGG